MAFASFFGRRRVLPAHQQSLQLERATNAVLEGLEGRLMLSTHRHRTTLAPAERISGATIGTGAYTTTRATELRNLYGVTQLTAENPAFPFFTGQGSGQSIVIIGSVPSWIDTRPNNVPGNLADWSGEQGVGGIVNVALDPLALGGNTIDDMDQNDYDTTGDMMTTAMIEWTHAMAPLASITVVECPTTNGVIDDNTLSLAIQEAVRVNQLNGTAGPINGFLPGGVVEMGVSSQGEDATTAAMFDSLFSYKYAATDSFIAPAGDYGGIPSMPADSPWVTSVGGTDWQTVTTTNGTTTSTTRSFEIADPNSGGGLSTVESVPAFQRGLTANGKRLTTRGAVDVAMAEMTPANTGGDTYWDPTPDDSASNKHYEVVGTEIATAMFAGLVADVNELRLMSGLGPIGRDLNNELYATAKSNPGAFFDITQGHNTLYQASTGYDLVSGLGAPNANVLVPALAGITSQAASANVTADFTFANNGVNTGNLVVAMRNDPTNPVLVTVGNQFLDITNPNSTTSATLRTPTTLATATQTVVNPDGSTTTTTATATLVVNGLLVRNLNGSVSGTGTVTVNTNAGTATMNVSITGTASVSRGRTRVSLQITTVNSRGKKVPFGLANTFQASISV